MANYTPQYMTQPVMISYTDADTGAEVTFQQDPLYCLTQDSANQLAALFSAYGLVGTVAMGMPNGYPVVYGGYTSSAQVPWIQWTYGKQSTKWLNAGVEGNFFNHNQPYLTAFLNCLADIESDLG